MARQKRDLGLSRSYVHRRLDYLRHGLHHRYRDLDGSSSTAILARRSPRLPRTRPKDRPRSCRPRSGPARAAALPSASRLPGVFCSTEMKTSRGNSPKAIVTSLAGSSFARRSSTSLPLTSQTSARSASSRLRSRTVTIAQVTSRASSAPKAAGWY